MQEKEENPITLFKLYQSFQKVHQGLDEEQRKAIEAEMNKIVPTEESEVLLAVDFDEEENSMGMSIYVSKPQSEEMEEAKESKESAKLSH